MANFTVTASDTGLTVTVALSRIVGRAQPTTTGLTITTAIKLSPVRRLLADTGLVFSDSARAARRLSVTGLTVTDSISTLFAPHGLFPDAGLTIADSISSAHGLFLDDSVLAITDAMVVLFSGGASVSLTDDGVFLTEDIQKFHSTALADTGLVVTDATDARPMRVRLLVDRGLTFADAISPKVADKSISDIGATVTDTLRRSYPIVITTTGLAVTDTTLMKAGRSVSDQGAAVLDTLVARLNGHNTSVTISERGLAVTDSIGVTRSFLRSVPIYLPDTGLTVRDGVRIHSVPPKTCVKPQAKFAWASLLLSASFTDTSTPGADPIESWDWSFGDGATSSAANPSHTYAAGGTYIVRLTVTTVCGTSAVSKPITVSGTVGPGTHIDGVIL